MEATGRERSVLWKYTAQWAVLLVLLSFPIHAELLEGVVVGVADGDTFDLLEVDSMAICKAPLARLVRPA